MANGDAETGVTVHWVAPKFDTGEILVQRPLPIEAEDTVGANLLVEALTLIETGNPPYLPQNPEQATYHSWPTPADVRRFKQRGRRYGSLAETWKDLTE
ncbi:MAG: hypothetical protein B6I38_10060 [Anaerolineaceae bacterium 4572_5.1]|nr:MAG: hypothetical protein B6I38_10060 [Anaerolineaceae bacterium 4572_5.1]